MGSMPGTQCSLSSGYQNGELVHAQGEGWAGKQRSGGNEGMTHSRARDVVPVTAGNRQVLAYMMFGSKASYAPNVMLRCGPPSLAPSVLSPACLVLVGQCKGWWGGMFFVLYISLLRQRRPQDDDSD